MHRRFFVTRPRIENRIRPASPKFEKIKNIVSGDFDMGLEAG